MTGSAALVSIVPIVWHEVRFGSEFVCSRTDGENVWKTLADDVA